MTRIRCKYIDCAFLDDHYCSAALIELDSDKGCLTYAPAADSPIEDDWEETEELEEWDDLEEDEDKDEDLWMEEEEEDEY